MSMYFGPIVIPSMLATTDDLATWTQTAVPDNSTVLLRSATSLVLDATEGAYYSTEPDTGLPTDTRILDALRDATCIQAAAWDAIKYNPLAGGVVTALVKGSKKIGSASFTVEGAQQASASQAAAGSQLVPEAMRLLQQNDLLGNGPYTL